MKLLTVLSLLLAAAFQDAKKPPAPAPQVDESKVQQAIEKGVAYLRTAPSPPAHAGIKNSDELILWTLIHAGIPETDAQVQKLLKGMLAAPLEKTYKVALQAMILEELERVKHQGRIAQCAQFLMDNQCQNGQWGYGSPSEFVKEIETPRTAKPVATETPKEGVRDFGPAPAAERKKPKVVQEILVKKLKEGPAAGDNSNTQYAALGLRACYDSGIMIPEPVVVLAVKWWRESQHPADPKEGVYAGRGWNYKDPAAQPDKKPYLAMTAGGTSCLVIYDYMLGREWKRDTFVKNGMTWLADNFAANTNYYYMYGLERTGILYGTEKFGDHEWYPKGAAVLLKAQKPDGSWGKHKDGDKDEADRNTHDTCFAILFLRRATRALVITESGKTK